VVVVGAGQTSRPGLATAGVGRKLSLCQSGMAAAVALRRDHSRRAVQTSARSHSAAVLQNATDHRAFAWSQLAERTEKQLVGDAIDWIGGMTSAGPGEPRRSLVLSV
jgi:hypothetical protein